MSKSLYLLGDPVAQSKSPAMHNAAYAAMGLEWRYAALQTSPQQLAERLGELHAQGAIGLNLTIPLKQTVMPLLESLSPAAQAIGAVNTLRATATGWQGDNTDALGWLASWDEEIGLDLRGRRALVLGAGGAARAVVWALQQRQVSEVIVLNRSLERARSLAPQVAGLESFGELLRRDCVVVQTTSVGMWPDVEAQPVEWPEQLPGGIVAADLIYNPRPTSFLKRARELGCATLDGSGMLVHQAARAIAWWSDGQAVALREMRAAAFGS